MPHISVKWMLTLGISRWKYKLPTHDNLYHVIRYVSIKSLSFWDKICVGNILTRDTNCAGELLGIACQMDNILVFGSNKNKHDKRLCVTLKKLRKQEVTLNVKKCEFGRQAIKLLGHVMDKERVKIDPDKVHANTSFDAKKTVRSCKDSLAWSIT